MKSSAVKFCLLALAVVALRAFGELEVEGPTSPDIGDVKFEDIAEIKYRATVLLEGGKKLKGALAFGTDEMRTACKTPGGIVAREMKIAEIETITFMSWLPRKQKNDRYLFYPSGMKLVHGGAEYGDCSVPVSLWKLSFDGEKGRRYLYTYFLEFWIKDGWGNSGKKDFSYPMENPLPGTVKKIDFSH